MASIRTPELEQEILSRLANGETLRAICRSEGMPSEAGVRFWVVDDPDFAAQYARARGVGLDCIAEETIEIADDKARDSNDRRVAIDARKWFLSKLRPDKYGDRAAVELTGANGGPVQSTHEIVFVRPKEEK